MPRLRLNPTSRVGVGSGSENLGFLKVEVNMRGIQWVYPQRLASLLWSYPGEGGGRVGVCEVYIGYTFRVFSVFAMHSWGGASYAPLGVGGGGGEGRGHRVVWSGYIAY